MIVNAHSGWELKDLGVPVKEALNSGLRPTDFCGSGYSIREMVAEGHVCSAAWLNTAGFGRSEITGYASVVSNPGAVALAPQTKGTTAIGLREIPASEQGLWQIKQQAKRDLRTRVAAERARAVQQ